LYKFGDKIDLVASNQFLFSFKRKSIAGGGYRGGGGTFAPSLTDSGRSVALNLEFFVPIFRIASQ